MKQQISFFCATCHRQLIFTWMERRNYGEQNVYFIFGYFKINGENANFRIIKETISLYFLIIHLDLLTARFGKGRDYANLKIFFPLIFSLVKAR